MNDGAEMVYQLALEGARREIAALRAVIAKHELCHDSDLNVGPRQFLKSCGAFIRQQFPDCTDGSVTSILRHIEALP